jgi:DNA-binding transcriptional LysR family regulator
MNWEDLRIFRAVARAGTLSGAARLLNVDQATVSRRLASLEGKLNVRLIERLPREARLTAIGQDVLAEVVDIEAKAFKVERMAMTSSNRERTKVTITAPPILARHFFAPNIHTLSRRFPLVQLAIVSESRFLSLSRLEADLAVRLAPGIQDTDIIRKIGGMEFALYAVKNYAYAADPTKWEFIGYTERQADFDHKRWLYEIIGARRVVCELTDLSNQYEAACTGIGVAGLPRFVGDADERLMKLSSDQPMLNLDIWIATHPDRRNDMLVRNASNAIAELIVSSGLGIK